MKMYLENLKLDLLNRWKRAFDELSLLENHKENIVSEKYIPGYGYSLEDYGTPYFLQQGDKIFPQATVREIGDYHYYGFTTDGLPCYTSFRHTYNNINWAGYYDYSDSLVEYVEYCINTGIPSCIKRIQYRDGEKISYQSLSIDSRGSVPLREDLSREEAIEYILNAAYFLSYDVEVFHRKEGEITKAEGLAMHPGLEEYHYQKLYKYDTGGELAEIRTVHENGQSQLSYVRMDKAIDIRQLIADLADEMAIAIVDELEAKQVDVPLTLLELTYRSASRYIPLLSPRSLAFTDEINRKYEDEDVFDLIFLATELDQPYLEINPARFERSLTQFMQVVRREGKWDMANAMIRKVAHTLTTTKLLQRIPVGKEFAAYAVDWETDVEEFEDILRECGTDPKVITAWKERGWL
ncbi:hypothetical protein [Chitinophaga tropicalis]|uniref:Uncharacterized protein n=1 Tax=Chitinophaga tropicalis TaxID=2683588 RepID=A0A7K1U3L4_9BACT|nr:hypothetical protein [Chitinophaga tropicalis]MVT08941.1 hypothetical protein [Chitinophaga tropicalis]